MYISLSDTISPTMTVAELFQSGYIKTEIISTANKKVQTGIKAPTALNILREELLPG